jgi:hypothetical protein
MQSLTPTPRRAAMMAMLLAMAENPAAQFASPNQAPRPRLHSPAATAHSREDRKTKARRKMQARSRKINRRK